MKGATRERWQQLCEQAAVEQDPEKMLALITEINRLLSEKEERLRNLRLRPDGKRDIPVNNPAHISQLIVL